jgi:hypothetical protein
MSRGFDSEPQRCDPSSFSGPLCQATRVTSVRAGISRRSDQQKIISRPIKLKFSTREDERYLADPNSFFRNPNFIRKILRISFPLGPSSELN